MTGSPVERALLALDKMRRKVDELEGAAREPIAIIGAGCRLPGGIGSIDGLWEALAAGRDMVREVPEERWGPEVFAALDPSSPAERGRRFGAFLDDAESFDPAAFGISRREAAHMDPQQRVFLEVSVEALEDAGVRPSSLAGSRAGVFVGVYNADFRDLALMDAAGIDSHAVTGGANAVVAGRLSYALDLRGPSLIVDTACSSSLVALHLACQSLRQRECELALAGGVNLMFAPTGSLLAGKLFALSPDGRCKSFDASANGFVRGEGCGVVALKRLSDARRDGDLVRAVIRGSAVNQDGRSAGLTAPNAKAQEAVIRAALTAASVAPESIGYVEAHGSGTPLGDPIEVDALKAVYGRPRADGSGCAIGTVKTNLGHLEAAAGIAGLLKAIACLERDALPPHLHLRALNPRISLAGTPLTIPTRGGAWLGPRAPRRAAVSSFGVSGTNAHLVLEAAPEPMARTAARPRPELVALSARTPAALEALARELSRAQAPIDALARSLATRRDAHAARMAVVADGPGELATAIAARLPLSRAEPSRVGPRKIAFVFPGQGSQWLGMARQLLREEPVFAARLEEADRAVRAVTGWSVLEQLGATPETSRLEETEFAQPILFSVQLALAALWRAWGVEPSGVIGHSMGEVAAACVAGALTLEDAARVISVRSELVKRRRGHGAMALVELELAAAAHAIADEPSLSVAAANGPRTVLLSGAKAALERKIARLEAQGVFARFVKVDYASHSPEMDGLLDDLVARLASVRPRAGAIPIYSTVLERVVDGAGFDAAYWAKNLRSPVLFAPSLARMAGDGHEIFLELSPHPVLLPAMEQTLEGRPHLALASLRRDGDERRCLLEALGAIFEGGHPVELARATPEAPALRLPLTPWDHERLPIARPSSRGPRKPGHPLWGARLELVTDETVYEAELGAERPAYLGEHRVMGVPILPAAAYVELALLAGTERLGERPFVVEGLELSAPLALPDDGTTLAQAVIRWDEASRGVLTLASGREALSVHARARITPKATPELAPLAPLEAGEERSGAEQLRALEARGLAYGPAFRGLDRLRLAPGLALAEVVWTPRAREDGERYLLHPALLDACLQALSAAVSMGEGTYVPAAIARVVMAARPTPGRPLRVLASARAGQDGVGLGELRVYAEDGAPLLALEGVRLARADHAGREAEVSRELGYALAWEPAPAPAPRAPLGPTSVVGEGPLADRLRASLAARGVARDDAAPEHVIFAASLALPIEAAPTLAALREGVRTSTVRALELAKALVKAARTPRLWLVTHGAQARGGPVGLAQAPLWGLGRSIAEEHPELRITLVDLPAEVDERAFERLADELAADDDERAIRLGADTREVARLVRAPRRSEARPARGRPFGLCTERPGTLEELALEELTPPSPGPGEVVIEARAAALNFLDVLTALGARPDRPAGPARLGGECAGVVLAVGPGVEDVRVGDEVVAVADGAMASHVLTRAALTAPKPARLSFEEAAALPIAGMTAYYALVELAHLERGERVLIHAATGGVGLAALEIARHLGAEVFATAGSPEKLAYLEGLGVAHRMSSRTLDFTDEILARTQGRGVDVVLNCLTGPAIERGLAALAPYGRFVEIAKRDIYGGGELPLAPFRSNLSYHAVDLARMMSERPERVGRLLRELMRAVERGSLAPLPITSAPIGEARATFARMAEAKHLGKLVLSIHGEDPPIRALPGAHAIPREGAILITGGLGGIGIELARDLVARGARHLLLAGRSAPDARAAAAIEALSAEARVEALALDVGDEAEVARTFAALEARGVTVTGVFHAAAVLEDGVLANQDEARLWRALRPKLDGAWNLHTHARDARLFVLFSSAASLLGSAAQAPYAAGNAFLDALAAHRRALGLPALSLSFGPWAEVGLAAADERRGKRLAEMGMGSLSPAEGLEALRERLDPAEPPHLAILPLDLRQWLEANPRAAASRFWSRLRGEAAAPTKAGRFVDALQAADTSARAELMLAHVREQLGKVLRLAPEKIGPSASFGSLGLDSLTGLEVRNRLENSLGLRLPATLLWAQPTASALAARLLGELGLGERGPAPPPPPPAAPATAAPSGALEELSEEELARQLAAELAQLRGGS